MSWAAVAQKAKDVTPTSAEPKRVVFTVDHPNDNSNKTDSGDVNTCHYASTAFPAFQKGLLVLDANAFIKGMDNLAGLADALVTTSQVLAEVRDRAARELLECLPHPLHVREPSREALAAIISIATKTGDLGAMSRTDIRLCALALDCCNANGSLLPPIKPEPAKINPWCDRRSDSAVQSVDEDAEIAEDEGDEQQRDPYNTSNNDHSADDDQDHHHHHHHHQEEGNDDNEDNDDDDDDDDDEQGWITPENIDQFDASGEKASGVRFDGGVACVTSDYAMQNTLLHVGVPIVGMQGMRIRELRHWLLRCTSCFSITTDTTRQFCSACGSGNTLRRVQYVLTSDGKRQLFINFRKTISTRGTVYNLPKPRGGKCGTNRCLVLREDQLAHVIRGTTSAKLKEKYVTRGGNENSNNDEDYDLAAFGEAPKHHKRDLNQPRIHSSYHKYNVNEKKKARASRRK